MAEMSQSYQAQADQQPDDYAEQDIADGLGDQDRCQRAGQSGYNSPDGNDIYHGASSMVDGLVRACQRCGDYSMRRQT